MFKLIVAVRCENEDCRNVWDDSIDNPQPCPKCGFRSAEVVCADETDD